MSTFGKIGARDLLEHRKFARDYIQDGLIAMWDAVENAGMGTHDPAATIWKDLVGSRDLTCSNVSWERNWATFAGNGYAHRNETDSTGMIAENRTMETCFRTSSNVDGMDVVNIWCGDSPLNSVAYPWRLCVSGYSGRIIVANGRNISPHPMFTRDNTAISKGVTFSVTAKQSSILGGFWNGNTAVASGSEYRTTGGMSEDIGCGDTTRRLFTGDVGCVRCYNRVLSQAEIAYNCAIDKIRFNLP